MCGEEKSEIDSEMYPRSLQDHRMGRISAGKMADDEEELGTDQVPADAMRSTPPWQAEPERKEAMRSRRLTLRS